MSNINFENTSSINGPINLVRLEGKINGINKVLYIFFDIHLRETRCSADISLDVDQYIMREFSKLNEIKSDVVYDFYLEYPIFMLDPNTGIRGSSYFQDLGKTIIKKINFDDQKDIMKISKFGPKLRIHLIDIRENILNEILYRIQDALYEIDNKRMIPTIMNLNSFVGMLKNFLNIISNNLKPDIQSKNKNFVSIVKRVISKDYPSPNEMDAYLIKIIYKLYHEYSNKEIKKIINAQLNELIKETKKIINKTEQIIKDMMEYDGYILRTQNMKFCGNNDCTYGVPLIEEKKMLTLFHAKIYEINTEYLNMFSIIMDLYFVRRFLEKNYATNGICYVGAFHSSDIIHILVKYFEFQVTHFYFSEILELNKLNKFIKDKNTSCIDIWNNFNPQEFKQCIQINKFPKNFL